MKEITTDQASRWYFGDLFVPFNDAVKHCILSYPDVIEYTDVNDDNKSIKEDLQKGFC